MPFKLRPSAASAAIIAWLFQSGPLAAQPPAWLAVDTRALTLTVVSGDGHMLARFQNIAIGSGGAASLHRAGDATTPLGTYHIAWINRHSRFGIFYGLDYPGASEGERAYAQKLISGAEYDAILAALRHGRLPPQNTALGGHLGIHGIGAGDPAVQRSVNWTDGCIALPNAQAQSLSTWVGLGTKVLIR